MAAGGKKRSRKAGVGEQKTGDDWYVVRTETQTGRKPLLGVVGGMGTQVTACFYEKLHTLQNVKAEQEYLDIILYSKPTIPDRTAYITGKSSESPLESLLYVIKTLEAAGASCIAVPCITSHFFYNELTGAVNIPVLNILDETAVYTAGCGFKNVTLLATNGTLKGGVFHSAFKKHGISVSDPPDEIQSLLMEVIYDIKRGATVSRDTLDSIIKKSRKTDTDAVVLGCTELCTIKGDRNGMIDTLDILAAAALALLR